MKYVICAAALVLSPVLFAVSPMLTFAAENQPWAYPVAPKGAPKRDAAKIVTVPGSDKKYNEVEVNNAFGPPDWFPNDHPPMPPVVANGRQPEPRACSLCHLTTGDGHPESAGIAGLPVGYIMRTLQDFKEGRRKGLRALVSVTLPEPGLYTVSAFGSSGSGQRWVADGCRNLCSARLLGNALPP